MSNASLTPLASHILWLSRHAGFPASRLSEDAALLLLMAVAQQAEEEEERARGPIHFQRRVGAQTSALKAHALRRSQVHFKCDNSAKV